MYVAERSVQRMLNLQGKAARSSVAVAGDQPGGICEAQGMDGILAWMLPAVLRYLRCLHSVWEPQVGCLDVVRVLGVRVLPETLSLSGGPPLTGHKGRSLVRRELHCRGETKASVLHGQAQQSMQPAHVAFELAPRERAAYMKRES